MGKVSKWFRGLLSLKKPDSSSPSPTTSAPRPPKQKRRWSFVKSYRQNDNLHPTTVKSGIHHNDVHTVAGAASFVIRLGSSGGCAGATLESAANSEEWAAVKIQAAFRGCLARRALRALKGLVKLQALVRGHMERKRMAEWLQKVQAVLRAQARVHAGRLNSSLSVKSSNVHIHVPATPDKVESPIRSKSMKYDQSSILKRGKSKSFVQISGNKEKCWNTTDSWVEEKSWNRQRSSVRTCVDDERNVRILEMDSGKQNLTPKRRARNLFHSTNLASQSLSAIRDSTSRYSGPIHHEVQQSYSPPEVHEVEETPFCTANNSPQFFSASSREGSSKSPFTPTRSDGSRSYLNGYSDRPSYMAYTESSKAKVRSFSAPKQRPRYEGSRSSNRFSINGIGESRLAAQRVSALHANFASKAYPGSGRFDKLVMPMGYR